MAKMAQSSLTDNEKEQFVRVIFDSRNTGKSWKETFELANKSLPAKKKIQYSYRSSNQAFMDHAHA